MEVHQFRLATNREVRLSKVDIDACRMPCRTGLGSDWRALAGVPCPPDCHRRGLVGAMFPPGRGR
jgi:hypothetical protein